MKVEIQLSISSENENGIWNSVFQSRRKMKNKNRSLNLVFGNRRKTENANGFRISFSNVVGKRLALGYTHCFALRWRSSNDIQRTTLTTE